MGDDDHRPKLTFIILSKEQRKGWKKGRERGERERERDRGDIERWLDHREGRRRGEEES